MIAWFSRMPTPLKRPFGYAPGGRGAYPDWVLQGGKQVPRRRYSGVWKKFSGNTTWAAGCAGPIATIGSPSGNNPLLAAVYLAEGDAQGLPDRQEPAILAPDPRNDIDLR
jgi:hypothetical protein